MPSTIDDCKLLFPVVFKLVSISHLLVGLTLFALYQLDRGSAQDKDSSYLGLFKRRYVFFFNYYFSALLSIKTYYGVSCRSLFHFYAKTKYLNTA